MVRDDDENHPLMQEAAKDLIDGVARITFKYGSKSINTAVPELEEWCKAHKTRWRQRGVDFPVMAIIVFNRFNQVLLLRRDLDTAAIRGNMLNVVKRYPTITPLELFLAFKTAYPELKSIVDEVTQEAEVKLIEPANNTKH